MKKLILLPFLIISTLAFASAPNRTYNYVSHAVIDPTQNNTNENTLYSYLQNGVDTFAAGSITDIAISSSAAISYSKLNLLNSIQGTDINTSAAIPYSKLNLTGTIVNADIASGAAIVDSKLSTISTAGKVSGSSLTSFSSIPSGAGLIPTANLGSGTANSGTILYGDQTYKAVVDENTSNVLFQYSAVTANSVTLGTGIGEMTGSSNVPTTGGLWRFLETRQTQSLVGQVWQTKWKKVAGVSTITINAEIWFQANITDAATLTVAVGSATGTVTGTTNQSTPEWKSFTIDVSGLSNGTTYTVNASLAHNAAVGTSSIYLGNLIAFGS